jgi:TatD DNase family protein
MPAPFADSHGHLADPAFADDRDAVITAAREAGARALVCIGESPDAADRARAIAVEYPGLVWHTAGMHPHEASSYDLDRDLPRLREHVTSGAVAIGECGLDYHYGHSPRDTQRAVFQAQLQLAAELRRPVVVHTREAIDDTAAMIREAAQAGVLGVMHCFTGPASLAEVALAAGWYVSFAGVVTFRKWTEDDLIRSIPDDRILVESDAPYLTPVPFRGKRNEPAHVALTVAKVATVRGVTAEEFGQLTVVNAVRCFGLAPSEAHL